MPEPDRGDTPVITHISPRRRATTFLVISVATGVVLGLLSSIAPAASATANTKPEIARTQAAWTQSLLRLPRPKTGCYTSSFPRVEWKPVTCGVPPRHPAIPLHGHSKPFTVGNGGSNDFAGRPTPTIVAVEGTFPSPSPGLTESGPIANSGPAIADTYTLQVNTNNFTSAACAGSPNPNCKGWEQFVYENNPSVHWVYVQYWLIMCNANCPAGGWTQFPYNGGPRPRGYCMCA